MMMLTHLVLNILLLIVEEHCRVHRLVDSKWGEKMKDSFLLFSSFDLISLDEKAIVMSKSSRESLIFKHHRQGQDSTLFVPLLFSNNDVYRTNLDQNE